MPSSSITAGRLSSTAAVAPLLYGFPPVARTDARVLALVLGSMPGAASLRLQQYYGHPLNAFWKIMGAVLGFDPALTYEERTGALLQHQVALWDVLDACARPGSLAAPVVHEARPVWRRAPYRAVFISDLHLGTPGCQAEELLEFLEAHPSDYLYLVGDIVDGWQLRRRWYWPQSHNDIVQKIMSEARKGCRVIFIPGNHDEFARQFAGHHFGGIEVALDAVHVTEAGQRLWIIHGDAFDGVVQCARWLAVVGGNLYEFTLRLNRYLNRLRRRFGLPYWSLSAYLKHKVKTALNYVTDFETAVAAEARRRGHDGVVCGHIHRAEMRYIDGTLYCNDGDWVESRTALVEHPDGRLELRHWATQAAGSDAVATSTDSSA